MSNNDIQTKREQMQAQITLAEGLRYITLYTHHLIV